MCGRYTLAADGSVVEKRYLEADASGLDWQARFSIAPTDAVPVVLERLDDDGAVTREIELARWDFRPSWRTDKRPQFNARLETVATTRMFQSSFAQHRAVVPMTGYYEWTGNPGSKVPHYIQAGAELLSAAGLYTWRKVDDGWEISCVVITREARDASGEVHDRMPVFLTDEAWAEWLTPGELGESDKADMLHLLDASSQAVAKTLGTFIVDPKVNSTARVDPYDPSLIVPKPS